MLSSFNEAALLAIKETSNLCVGIDPSKEELLKWGLEDSPKGLNTYCEILNEAIIGSGVKFAKPQSAFFERHGVKGLAALETCTIQLKKNGVLTILDCKRGDIGSTAVAYADAYMSLSDSAKYDAITVNPFLGPSSIEPFLEQSAVSGAGVFLLLRTSNPDSYAYQNATAGDGEAVACQIAKSVQRWRQAWGGKASKLSVGGVIGATLQRDDVVRVTQILPDAIFLCPGIGSQGATPTMAKELFRSDYERCIFPVSRGISVEGPEVGRLKARIGALVDDMAVRHS